MSPPLLRSLAVVALLVCGLALLAGARWLAALPDLARLEEYRPALPTEVRARGGEKIGEFAAERRRLVTLDELPPHVVQAFLAAEDSRFYEHGGLDLSALSRAAWVNLSAGGRIRQGGSTITQQLAKSLLGNERTMSRKLRDMALALRIEWSFDKDEILTLYLNEIYLGNGAYGVAQAARSYFDVDVAHLDVSQAALIAGLTKAPSKYAPDVNPEAAEERRRYVLEQMRLLGYLDDAAYRSALAAAPQLRAPQTPEAFSTAAWFVEEVRRLLVQRIGADALLRGGYVVETTLDLPLQRTAEHALRSGVDRFEQRGEKVRAQLEAPIEAALVSLDVASGDVVALVGGYDFAQSQFNRATQARRQPGSAFKPFVYGAALESGFQVSASLYDVQVDLRDRKNGRRWKPRNSSGSLRGIVPMHEALARSLNNATVRLLMDVGVERSVAFARRAGIVAPLAEDYGIALGTSGVSPLELTRAYATIAGGGVRHTPRFITRVLDRDGNVALADLSLLGTLEAAEEAALPPLTPVDAYLLTHLLRQPIRQGYGTAHAAARIGVPLAGKTGSTNENRDAWFVGYSPRIATGVWVGRDRLAPLGRNGTGARAALPIWIEFMAAAVADDDTERSFPIPEGVHFAGQDRESGGWIRTERFIPGFEPYAVGRRIRKSTVVALPKPPEAVPVAVAVQTPVTTTPGPLALPLIPNGIDGLPSVGAGPLRPPLAR